MPRKKIPADLRSLARCHTEMGVKVLAGIASAEDAPPAARVAAVTALFDRGWGKAQQPLNRSISLSQLRQASARVRDAERLPMVRADDRL
jgi:hypothetical protein